MYVIDGCYLLHKVRWFKGVTIDNIADQYVKFVKGRFGHATCVVFDGYSTTEPSTKDHEHARRVGKISEIAPIVNFDPHTVISFDQDSILANIGNKQNLVCLLSERMQSCGISTKTSVGDADVDIVSTALDLAHDGKTVVVYAEDTDILVLLLHHKSSVHRNIFMKSDPKNKSTNADKCIDIGLLQEKLGCDVCEQLLVLHSFGGCDTTLAIYGHSKGSLLASLSQHTAAEIHSCVATVRCYF